MEILEVEGWLKDLALSQPHCPQPYYGGWRWEDEDGVDGVERLFLSPILLIKGVFCDLYKYPSF